MGTFLLAVLAIACLAFAFTLPWFSYETSSGRQTAEGGFNDPENTQVERHRLTYSPSGQSGDVTPTDPNGAQEAVAQLGWALYGAIGLLAIVAIGEIPPFARWMPRLVSLFALALAFGAAGFALYIGWFRLPATLAGYGIDGPFTTFLAEDGYTRTTLEFGWAAAAVAVPLTLGALLWKFQAGSDDLVVPGTAE